MQLPKLKTLIVIILATGAAWATADGSEGSEQKQVHYNLRAWGVPDPSSSGVEVKTQRRVLKAFREKVPYVTPVATTGLNMGGSRKWDITPLMQIAGDIAPHVLYVNFRKSHTYIHQKFLYPLDRFVEQAGNGTKECDYIPNSHLLSTDEYLEALKKLPRYEEEFARRIPRQCWEIIRRYCPYAEDCPYCVQWGIDPGMEGKHRHIWAFPEGPWIGVLTYRKDLFAEAQLEDRVPATWEELLTWARLLTNPLEDRYGMFISLDEPGWSTMNFLFSAGGRILVQDEHDQWHCSFDSPAAVEAYYYVARFFLEPFENEHGQFDGVVFTGDEWTTDLKLIAMRFSIVDERFFSQWDVAVTGFGPVPLGLADEQGQRRRGAEYNSQMCGIYAGIEDPVLRDAAWEYILFYDGPEARRIRTETYIEEGQGRFVQPTELRAAGYTEYLRQVPKGWEKAFTEAMNSGIPEPYGKNCDMAYRYVSKAINQIRTDGLVKEHIRSGSEIVLKQRVESGEISADEALQHKAEHEQQAKARIEEILHQWVRIGNEKMLGILAPTEAKKRRWQATGVAIVISLIFVFMFRYIFRVFHEQVDVIPGQKRGRWEFSRYKWAYILALPALGSIVLWMYYPLIWGTKMAFLNYNVRGFSEWVGMSNFAAVLYDEEFHYALWVTIKYAVLFILFAFAAPIVLAFLLTEVPKGKILFRTIYYLPAVLTGTVVLLLWKGFYDEYGLVNKVVNVGITMLNWFLPAASELAFVHIRWLENKHTALLFCLLPSIWAGMGPGCLIYLAALKTVPDDLYEAADVDGAGIVQKVRFVAVPSIKGLIMINFIGAVVATIKNGGDNMLAMTGGGPYTPYGETEVAGLHIFFEAFAYLRFGTAVSMAWILGAMMVGFTIFQMKRLSKMEFKTANGI